MPDRYAILARYETTREIRSGVHARAATPKAAERIARRLAADARYSSVTIVDWLNDFTGWTS